MRINQLEFLVSANRNGSFSKAAQELYVTQPAISAGIKELEEELRFRIFDRDKSGLKLTDEGKVIVPWAEEALRNIGRINSFAKRLSDKPEEFCVAATRFIYNTILFLLPEQVKEMDPSIHIKTEMNDGAGLLRAIAGGEVDCGIIQLFGVEEAEIERARKSGIVFEKLWRDAFVFMCGENHPLAGAEKLTISDIFQYDIVSYLPIPEAPIMHAMEQNGFAKRIININDMISVRKYLLSNDAVGFTPYASFITVLDDYGGGLATLMPEDVLFDYDVCLVYKNHTLSTADKAIYQYLRNDSAILTPYPGLN